MQNVEVGATQEEAPACEMSEGMMESEPQHYAGMAVPEVRSLLKELASPNVQDLDEKLAQLEQVLIDRLGPDPKIPKAIDALSAAYTLIELGEKANTVGGSNSEELNAFLDYAPAIVLETLVETSIELFHPSEAEAARGRALVERFEIKLTHFKCPRHGSVVETAIKTENFPPEDGAPFWNPGQEIMLPIDSNR